MRRDGTRSRSDIVCGVQAALREVKRGETGLSLLCRWIWMHKRVKESETERKKKYWMMCIFNSVFWDSSDQPCIKTHLRFQYTHPFVCYPSINQFLSSSPHHPSIIRLLPHGSFPADCTVPACGANISHYGVCNVGITPLCLVLSAPTRQLLSTDGTSSLQPPPLGVLLYESQITLAGLQ